MADRLSTSPDLQVIPEARPPVDAQPVDEQRMEELLHRLVNDMGAALAIPLALLGDRHGLFEALEATGAVTSGELAERTGLAERYLREWLLAMAASGYVDYAGDGRYRLSPEQAEAFCHPDSPAYLAGGLQNLTACTRALDRITDAFRTGEGMGWHEHHPDVFHGTERFFRPSYVNFLTSMWIPALTGLEQQLQAGARVADVGCGFGASTRIMAAAYPASTFVGLDYHQESIEAATGKAIAEGFDDRVSFRTGSASELTGDYDLITYFDCLHDMPDPLSALRAARRALSPDGWVLLVEPMGGDTIEEGLNPVGRVYAAASVLLCLPSGLSAEPRAGLGNQAGPALTLALAREAGFTRAREATRTPFNIIYELRP